MKIIYIISLKTNSSFVIPKNEESLQCLEILRYAQNDK